MTVACAGCFLLPSLDPLFPPVLSGAATPCTQSYPNWSCYTAWCVITSAHRRLQQSNILRWRTAAEPPGNRFIRWVRRFVCVCVSVGRPGAEQTVAPAPILCAQCSFPSKGWSKPCKVNFYLLIKSSSAQSAAGGWKLNILLMVWWKVLASSGWTDSLTEKTPPSSQGERGRKTLFIHGARWSQSLPREGDLNV